MVFASIIRILSPILLFLSLSYRALSCEFSTVFDNTKAYAHLENKNNTNYISVLVNNKTNLLLYLCLQENQTKISIGDTWLNFGRGLVLGNPKYNYFTKYQTLQKILTNTSYPFNLYFPTTRGVYFEVKHLAKTSLFIISDYHFSLTENSFGGIVELLDYGILVGKIIDTTFVSFNYRSHNLLRLGIVGDIETAIIISSNLSFGFGAALEWYYKKFEFSTEFRIQDPSFESPLSSKMFSKQNFQKGIIFSGKLNEKDRKFSLVSKITHLSNNQIDTEFLLFLAQKTFKNTFLDIELLKDSSQNTTFISFFPFFDFETINFTIKPIMNLEQKILQRVEGKISVSVLPLKFKLNFFYPIIRDDSYTFTSMEIRDLFGENVDIQTKNSEGIKIILSIVLLTSTIKSEIAFSVSETTFNLYGTLTFKIQP